MKITDGRKSKPVYLAMVSTSCVFEYADQKPSWARSKYMKINRQHEHYLPQPGYKHVWVFDLEKQTVCRHREDLRIVILESELVITGVIDS